MVIYMCSRFLYGFELMYAMQYVMGLALFYLPLLLVHISTCFSQISYIQPLHLYLNHRAYAHRILVKALA